MWGKHALLAYIPSSIEKLPDYPLPMLLRHRFLDRFGDLPCESCNIIVLFIFYLIIVSSAYLIIVSSALLSAVYIVSSALLSAVYYCQQCILSAVHYCQHCILSAVHMPTFVYFSQQNGFY